MVEHHEVIMAGAYSWRGEETRENESATTHQIVEI